mgnify:CR=1 FL=1
MIQVKEEFKNLIPALSAEEYAQLEANILEDGIREPIITWNGFIIDGHNRFSIAQRFDLEYKTTSKYFSNDNLVKIWMLDNQFGKRNLTDAQRYLNRNEKRKLLKAQGVEKYKKTVGRPSKESLSTIDNDLPKHNTRKEIADELGWSTGKVAMADVVFKKATPEVIEKVNKSEVSINAAYKEIKKEEKKEELQEKKKEYEKRIESNNNNEFKIDIFNTNETFRVIYADPAWSYNDKQDTPQLGGASKHYDTMSIAELSKLPVNKISEKNSILFLWVTSPLLEDAFKVVSSWGFKYKTSFIWDKVKHNMGHYNSVRHEILLVCTKGSCTPDNKVLYNSVQRIERNNNHSEKPIEFLNIIDDLYSYGNKLEMFCRTIKKEKWYGWGNEL